MRPQREKESRALLCVDEKDARFERLKTAVRDYDHGIEITCVPSVDAALQRLAERNYTAVIVAPEFEEEELRYLTSTIQNLRGGEDVAVVMIISSQNNYDMEEEMSIGLLIGANGFLKDPFSTSGVQETIGLSETMKKQRLEQRQRDTLAFSLREARKLIDNAALLGNGNDGRILKAAESVKSSIHQCEMDNPELYYRLVVGSFIRLSLQDRPISPESYAGSSKRVKQQVTERIADSGGTAAPTEGSNSDGK